MFSPTTARLLLALLLLPLAPARADDLVPAAIEAVISQPDDPDFFGIQDLLPAEPLWVVPVAEPVRCLAVVPDQGGDGLEDFVVGLGPAAGASRPLALRDGADGSVRWRAAAGAGFRSLRALAAREGRLAAAASAPRGRLAVHALADGAVLWERELAPDVDGLVTLHTVRWLDDLDGDEVPELLVTAGEGRDAALLVSGVDGSTLWSFEPGDVVYDAVPLPDLDGDGRPEIAVCGGDDAPFAALLDGADGTPLWSIPLDGPGSALLVLDDRTDDGVPELAVGQFATPDSCLLQLDGADGGRIWAASGVTQGVTTLLLLDDLVGTGLRDIGVGSFDNAITAVLSLNGVNQWRRETSSNNGGHVFSIAQLGDLDGNGTVDVVGAAQDRQAWFVEGAFGQYLARHDARARCHVVAGMPDRTADGRQEILLASERELVLLDGEAGLAGGPVSEVKAPQVISNPAKIVQWTLPATQLWIFAALGTQQTPLPNYGTFGLELASTVTLIRATAPGAGMATVFLGPLPREASGLEIFVQSASIYEPGEFGLLSDVASYVVP